MDAVLLRIRTLGVYCSLVISYLLLNVDLEYTAIIKKGMNLFLLLSGIFRDVNVVSAVGHVGHYGWVVTHLLLIRKQGEVLKRVGLLLTIWLHV